jgi:hypothetical protein
VPYHHGPNGKAAVVSAKMPGTPRREQSHRQEKAVQDPGLKDYVGGDVSLLSWFGLLLLLLPPPPPPLPSSGSAASQRHSTSSWPVPVPDLLFSFPLTGLGFCAGAWGLHCTARPFV